MHEWCDVTEFLFRKTRSLVSQTRARKRRIPRIPDGPPIFSQSPRPSVRPSVRQVLTCDVASALAAHVGR